MVMELALVRLMMAKATDDDTQDVPVPPRIVYCECTLIFLKCDGLGFAICDLISPNGELGLV